MAYARTALFLSAFLTISTEALGSPLPKASGCPASITLHQLRQSLPGFHPDRIKLLSSPPHKPKQLKAINWQIATPLPQLKHTAPPSKQTPGQPKLFITPQDLGPPPQLKTLPCGSQTAAMLSHPDHGSALLVLCPKPVKDKASQTKAPLTSLPNQHTIQSPFYSYQYQADNPIVFQKIAHRPYPNAAFRTVAAQADMQLHLNVQNFFNMEFDRNNLSAETKGETWGPLSRALDLQLYVHLLFFTIDLEVQTQMHFFPQAAYVPMVFKLPVHAYDYLNPGSGVLLHWQHHGSRFVIDHPYFHMPAADPEIASTDFSASAKIGKTYCKDSLCSFSAVLQNAQQLMRIQATVPEAYVARGFFPQYVSKPHDFKQAMDWAGYDDDKQRLGIYFNNSGLPAGDHVIDYWFELLPSQPHIQEKCPLDLELKKALF